MNVSSLTSPSETLPASPGNSSMLPAWVTDLAGVHETDSNNCLRTATIALAQTMDDQTLEAAVMRSYAALFDALHSDGPWHPVRFWNFLPALRQESVQGRDRYHVFNSGRFKAFEQHYGSRLQFKRSVATASAIGSTEDDLVIHCLARRRPGVPVDNPWQVRPWKYSQRYGRLPPCFSRGTLVDGETLLVGGTASIVGEDSLHADDLVSQTQQTLVNLSALVVASGLRADRPLDAFRSLRVYHPRSADRAQLNGLLSDSFPNVGSIEFVVAEICRAELLVEIEGVCGEVLE